jgi:hypothetical protein
MRVTELPLEVRRALGWWRSSQVSRVFCAQKAVARSAAWAACREYGRAHGVKDEAEYTGWRSNHTENYWVWWAQDVEDVRALADVAREPEPLLLTPKSVDTFIEEAWVSFEAEVSKTNND